ncbi:MAG: sensor domain-containing diguanylate cyclase [Rhodoferax sp.]|uniref:diguanylate cyclase n=1 Tax=Rhodoferax sp. TaxID=50421 RepID=UPI0026105E74|nr:diguanylate cyclase [Rhodoferax sp.]MDD2880492.1 sensor domain-containing diguanylate cyclase [Rhodoferax sp.]
MPTQTQFTADVFRRCCAIRGWLRHLLAALVLLLGAWVQAAPLDLSRLPGGMLGQHADVHVEAQAPLTLAQARQHFEAGQFSAGTTPVLNFGLGARPVWARLELLNTGSAALAYRLDLSPNWTDQLDVFVVQGQKTTFEWHGGDAIPGARGVSAGLYTGVRVLLTPGLNTIFVRAQTHDPLQLTLALQTDDDAAKSQTVVHYAYGALYGFLLALALCNLALFAGLRQLRFLFYSLYVLCFVAANISYTGHGFAWVWPGQPHIQRYVILVFMVLYGITGFMFASRFLGLPKRLPRVQLGLKAYSIAAALGMGLCVLLDSHLAAAWLGFGFVVSFNGLMLALSAYALRSGQAAGRFFFAAMVCGVFGSALTTLSVAGVIAFTQVNFHAVEVGLLLEAMLLALALAQQFRREQTTRLNAQFLAQHDALTGLYNRRAFFELSKSAWALAQRNGHPLSVLMLDIDYFKQVNDRWGHSGGDAVLVAVSQTMAATCRAGDVLARWGGEEFIVLLPMTALEDARLLAERIRWQIAELTQTPDAMGCTASIGVTQYAKDVSLDKLIDRADAQLYLAKRYGRNQVQAG